MTFKDLYAFNERPCLCYTYTHYSSNYIFLLFIAFFLLVYFVNGFVRCLKILLARTLCDKSIYILPSEPTPLEVAPIFDVTILFHAFHFRFGQSAGKVRFALKDRLQIFTC